jgi:hypothetical protein
MWRAGLAAAVLALSSPVMADNISPWSVTGCGLWSANKTSGPPLMVGPASSIDTGPLGGNYGVNLDLTNCKGQPGPVGPQGPQGPAGMTGAQGTAGPSGAPGANGLQGPAGPQGPIGAAGSPGMTGAAGPAGLQGVPGIPGPQGAQGAQGAQGPQGIPGLPGTAFNVDRLTAISAAMAQPAWLERYERFSVTGGIGFADGSAAIGFTGIMRLNNNVAGYGGFAYEPHGLWAGRVGARVGW